VTVALHGFDRLIARCVLIVQLRTGFTPRKVQGTSLVEGQLWPVRATLYFINLFLAEDSGTYTDFHQRFGGPGRCFGK